jgi:hypothetical protein
MVFCAGGWWDARSMGNATTLLSLARTPRRLVLQAGFPLQGGDRRLLEDRARALGFVDLAAFLADRYVDSRGCAESLAFSPLRKADTMAFGLRAGAKGARSPPQGGELSLIRVYRRRRG